MIRTLCLGALALAACSPEPGAETGHTDPFADARPISFSELLERPRESADHRLAYGAGELEYGELWLPEGEGPHPVVVMIHGGCWLADLPGTQLQDYLAADLKARAIAVWNLEYARIGHANGGYPGTFADIAAGVDHLRALAGTHDLDIDRLVFVGHSAGGHLALWAAGRGRLPEDSVLHQDDPLIPDGVVTLAGINDLSDYRAYGPGRCGEPGTVDRLLEGTPHADVYADTSPPALLPIGVDQVVVSGGLDDIVPAVLGERYVLLARESGDTAQLVLEPEAGHFELIDPHAPAWPVIVMEIERLLGKRG